MYMLLGVGHMIAFFLGLASGACITYFTIRFKNALLICKKNMENKIEDVLKK